MSGEPYFVAGRPLSFEHDGLGLLGTALGIHSLPPVPRAVAACWLTDLLRQAQVGSMPLDWNVHLMRAAARVADAAAFETLALAPDLAAAMCERGVPGNQPRREEAWACLTDGQYRADGPTRAAARVAALDWVLRSSATIGREPPTVDNVARLLDGLAARSLRRWPWEAAAKTPKSEAARWVINNEYHVQSLLWAALAPIFPDLDDEEYLASLGQKQPRADLVERSLQLVIEVKFVRAAKRFADVIEEVAADASLYFSEGSSYRAMLVFVWDDSARTQEHAELRQGLLRLRNVAGVTVVSRPSHMLRDG